MDINELPTEYKYFILESTLIPNHPNDCINIFVKSLNIQSRFACDNIKNEWLKMLCDIYQTAASLSTLALCIRRK